MTAEKKDNLGSLVKLEVRKDRRAYLGGGVYIVSHDVWEEIFETEATLESDVEPPLWSPYHECRLSP